MRSNWLESSRPHRTGCATVLSGRHRQYPPSRRYLGSKDEARYQRIVYQAALAQTKRTAATSTADNTKGYEQAKWSVEKIVEEVVVISAGSKAAGAADLQSYVEKVSGAKLEIVTEDKLGQAKSGARVFVGPCLAASRVVNIQGLQPEGFVIKTAGAGSRLS